MHKGRSSPSEQAGVVVRGMVNHGQHHLRRGLGTNLTSSCFTCSTNQAWLPFKKMSPRYELDRPITTVNQAIEASTTTKMADWKKSADSTIETVLTGRYIFTQRQINIPFFHHSVLCHLYCCYDWSIQLHPGAFWSVPVGFRINAVCCRMPMPGYLWRWCTLPST